MIGASVSPDGKTLWLRNSDGTISVYCTIAYVLLGMLPSHGLDWIARNVVFSPDSTKAYVMERGDLTSSLAVVETASRKILSQVAVDDGTDDEAISPDGTELYLATHSPSIIRVIRTDTFAETGQIDFGNFLFGIAFNPDGNQLYGMLGHSINNTTFNILLGIIDAHQNMLLNTIPLGTFDTFISSNFLRVTPDGKSIWVLLPGQNPSQYTELTVISAATDLTTQTLNTPACY